MELKRDYVNELIGLVGEKDMWQKKYLEKLSQELDASEKAELEEIIGFFLKYCTMQFLVESYLLFINDTREETRYFHRYKKYRYAKVEDVEKKVYSNEEYMEKYMLGVQISGYLWKTHRAIHRYYKEIMKSFSGDHYLEIGPGHGQYFCEAINQQNFNHYIGIDRSCASIRLTNEYIERFKKDDISNYEIIYGDFMEKEFDHLFDGVCIAEVLEHLEHPDEALRKIYEITLEGSNVYISVPINGPEIDHIFLFRNIDEVLQMARKSGFEVVDYFYTTEVPDISYEKALEIGCAIILAVHLRHSQ